MKVDIAFFSISNIQKVFFNNFQLHFKSQFFSNFQTFVVFAGLLALAAGVPIPEDVEAVPALVPAPVPTFNLAPTLVRAPSHDSASIESHRLGGNFAYAVAEAHAFAKVTPQVSTITHPVAETTVVHEPATIAKVVPGAVTTTKHIPHPIIEHQPILAQEPVVEVGFFFF